MKRNGEKLLEQSLCDLLCKINSNLYEGIQCVLEAIEGKKQEKCRAQTCDDCIRKWMDEHPF